MVLLKNFLIHKMLFDKCRKIKFEKIAVKSKVIKINVKKIKGKEKVV